MREQLIGYVLGALDAPEQAEVETQLGQDPWLREQLDVLRKALFPLECDRGHLEPPPGLAATTCRHVLSSLRSQQAAISSAASTRGGAVIMRSGEEERHHAPLLRGWSFIDLAVAAGIVLAAGALFLPAINHSRFNAQITNCQNNLGQIGHALRDFAKLDPQGNYPSPVSGKLAAAGLYAPQLLKSGQVTDAKLFRCNLSANDTQSQSGPKAANDTTSVKDTASINDAAKTIPSMEEIQASDGDKLQEMLGRAGGSYGYTLGYNQDGAFHPTESLGRSNFPIMADAPCPRMDFQQSSNHEGFGENVLFDDGHVRYLNNCREVEGCPDHNFYRNSAGRIAAGTSPDDAVIGCSRAKPIEPVAAP